MKRILLFVILTFLLAACAPNPPGPISTDTATITPTITRPPTSTPTLGSTSTSRPTITLTSTPRPSITPSGELTSHTWNAEPVLVYVDAYGGDGGRPPGPPIFVLFSDGKLFTKKSRNGVCVPHVAQLSRQEICALLNTLDQIGFYDYDPETSDFQRIYVDGAGTVGIIVNSWESNSILAPQLAAISIYQEDIGYELPENLQTPINTFLTIYYFAQESLQPFRSENIELWLSPSNAVPDETETWPEDLPSLTELYEEAQIYEGDALYDGVRMLRLDGEIGYKISLMFEELPGGGVYTDGGITLWVSFFSLLPYTYPTYEQIPNSFYLDQVPPETTLTCYPSDGLLAIPEP